MGPESETKEETWRVSPAFSVLWRDRTRFMEQFFAQLSTGTIPPQPKPVQRSRPRWPFDGTFPPARVAQHDFSGGQVRVRPYQAGLGSIERGDPSYGCVPGNNDFALGINRAVTQGRAAVVVRGEAEVEVGAAINVGAKYYYRKKSGGAITEDPVDNPDYEKVLAVPLFEGESVPAGTEVFAGAMGHRITPDRKGMCPYPLTGPHTGFKLMVPGEDHRVLDDVVGVPSRSSFDENPWWDFADQTFRAEGVTATPPEPGQAVVVAAGPGLLGDSPANHGSRIFRKPLEPERAAGVGTLLETVEGSGTWPYTGDLDLPVSSVVPGQGYVDGPALGYPDWDCTITIRVAFNPVDTGNYEIVREMPGTPNEYFVNPGSHADLFYEGREFWALNELTCIKTGNMTGLVRFVVRSNTNTGPGVYKIVVGIAPGFVGEPFAYSKGDYHVLFATNYDPVELRLTTDGQGAIVSAAVTDPGLGFAPGYRVRVVQVPRDSGTASGGKLTLGTATNMVMRPTSGGAAYNASFRAVMPWAEPDNYCQLVDPASGAAVPHARVRIASVDKAGAVTGLSWDNIDLLDQVTIGDMAFVRDDFVLEGVEVNRVYELHHVPAIDGSASLKVSDTALVRIQGLAEVLEPGAGHVLGEILGGGLIEVTEVDAAGGLVAAEVLPQGSPVVNRTVFVTAKGARVIVRVRHFDTTLMTAQIFGTRFPDVVAVTLMRFTVEVLEPGSGYVVGVVYLTGSMTTREGANMRMLVDATDGGKVLSCSIVDPGNYRYEVGYVMTLGEGGCKVRLGFPHDPAHDYMVRGGSGYASASGVECANASGNTLLVKASGSGGSAAGSASSPVHVSTDFTRFNLNEQLRLITGPRSGRADTAISRISYMEPYTGGLNFASVSGGSGYPDMTNQWVETENVSYARAVVSLTANADGSVRTLDVTSPPTGWRYGDRFFVGQGNCVAAYVPVRDVPPTHELEFNAREPTPAQWEAYRQVMESATNLVGKKVKVSVFASAPRYANMSFYNDGDGGTDYFSVSGYAKQCVIL